MTMTPAERDVLETHLRAARRYLEFGAGGSTALAAAIPTLERIDSVESSEAFVRDHVRGDPAVEAALEAGRLHLHLVDLGETVRWGHPKDASRRHRWPAYSSEVFERIPSPDLVLVDGRFRVACALESLLHLAPEGRLLVHDFWIRPRYRPILRFVEEVDRADTLAVFRARPELDGAALRRVRDRYRYLPGDRPVKDRLRFFFRRGLRNR